MRKDSTSLSIQRTVRNTSTLLQRSSLPLLLVLLANDVHLNPGPFHPRPSEASPLGLKFLYLNARSLKAFAPHDNTDVYSSKVCKITLLQQLVHGAFYDVVCICETWLNESILIKQRTITGIFYSPSRQNWEGWWRCSYSCKKWYTSNSSTGSRA